MKLGPKNAIYSPSGVNEAGSMSAEGAEDVQSNSQATPIAFHAAWTNQGSTNGKCRRHAIEVVSSRGGESNRFCDPSHLGAQLFPRIREPAIWYFIWSAPPHSGRPFSTFRAPAARRILCAYGTQYYYGRGSGPWVCVLLGSELASLIQSESAAADFNPDERGERSLD